jgi:hypothetical protein
MKKLTLLAAAAVGYVLGSRAGRERYEQIKAGATKIAQDPRVRAKASEAGQTIKEQAPHVKDKVVGTATSATHAAKEKVGSHNGAADQSTPYPQS